MPRVCHLSSPDVFFSLRSRRSSLSGSEKTYCAVSKLIPWVLMLRRAFLSSHSIPSVGIFLLSYILSYLSRGFYKPITLIRVSCCPKPDRCAHQGLTIIYRKHISLPYRNIYIPLKNCLQGRVFYHPTPDRCARRCLTTIYQKQFLLLCRRIYISYCLRPFT